MVEGAIGKLIGSGGRRVGRFGRTPRIASQRLTEPGDIAIKSISQYYRDNEYLEALMI